MPGYDEVDHEGRSMTGRGLVIADLVDMVIEGFHVGEGVSSVSVVEWEDGCSSLSRLGVRTFHRRRTKCASRRIISA